jgi:photosystem II PsbY protein
LLQAGKVLSLTAVASSWMMSGHAQAATELSQLAASDNRFGTISLLFIPALGWVAFNIFQPLLNQLGRQAEIAEDAKGSSSSPRSKKKRSVAGAVGLGAALALAAAQQADAATELSQLAASDNRWAQLHSGCGWAGCSRAGGTAGSSPCSTQGLLCSTWQANAAADCPAFRLLCSTCVCILSADASSVVQKLITRECNLAGIHKQQWTLQPLTQCYLLHRFGTISLLFIPALGWVAFNIFQPLLNQLGRQAEIAEEAKGAVARVSRKKRSVAGAVGLGAALALAAAQQADAATELSQLAASDNRCGWGGAGCCVILQSTSGAYHSSDPCMCMHLVLAEVCRRLVAMLHSWPACVMSMNSERTPPILACTSLTIHSDWWLQVWHHLPAVHPCPGLGGLQHLPAPAEPAQPSVKDCAGGSGRGVPPQCCQAAVNEQGGRQCPPCQQD